MQITKEFQQQVLKELAAQRENWTGTDGQYAAQLGLSPAVFSRMKKGDIDKILSPTQWISLGRQLGVSIYDRKWKVARTVVYDQIADNLGFCQEFSKSMILVDDCGIGKTFCAKHIVRGLKNAFYFDCSQAKTRTQFIRSLAKTVGMDNKGKYNDVKGNLKYYLNMVEKPLIVLDEAGDLSYPAFLELKELWNGTEGACAWYMMGADGLKAKMNRGISNDKVGYAEIFSRFSDEFIKLVPNGAGDKEKFYRRLIADVASVNITDNAKIDSIVRKCLTKGSTLRYLETLIQVAA